MKHTLFNSIKIIGLAVVLALGISYVHAFTGPATSADIATPINNSSVHQTKEGGIVAKFFVASASQQGLFALGNPVPDLDGIILTKNMIKSVDGLFTKQFLVRGTSARVKIGDTQAISDTTVPDPTIDPIDAGTYTSALTVDLTGRGATSQTSRNAAELIANAVCKKTVVTTVDTNSIQFLGAGGAPADLIANQLRLNSSDAGAGKVLLSTNADGDARWATITVQGNNIVYDTGTSPVTAGLSCGGTPPPPPPAGPGCSNIGSINLPTGYPATPASGIPVGYERLPNGTCAPMQHYKCTPALANKWLANSLVIANPSNPYFHQPYCTSVTYQPGDKYYRPDSFICAGAGVVPDPTACSATGTPVLPSCGNYTTPCSP